MSKATVTVTVAGTKLEKALQRIVNRYAANHDDGAAGFIRDLAKGGCESGLVSELTYYSDSMGFYSRHKGEINVLLASACEECGCGGPVDLFGDKWDTADPLAMETHNQNLLAWFAFEETARNLSA